VALIDVSEILTDPDLSSDRIKVRRRQQIIDSNGRTTESIIEFNIRAVVTSDSPNDLRREDAEYAFSNNAISVICKFQLIGQAEGYFPDIVVFGGNNYLVCDINSYPQFGKGFYETTCISMDRNEKILDLDEPKMSFNFKQNSQYIGLTK
jgi:hypothetical protein